jgi:DNA ligase-4
MFKPVKGRLETVQHTIVSNFDDIIQEFSASIERNEEGIMLKDPDSPYLPKDRGANWLKLKGDYIDGLTDTLDLLVVGGFFGDKSYRQGDSNHWTDKVTTFVLGVI